MFYKKIVERLSNNYYEVCWPHKYTVVTQVSEANYGTRKVH
jgi:hypothetical protein